LQIKVTFLIPRPFPPKKVNTPAPINMTELQETAAKKHPLEILENIRQKEKREFINISAPMVRYSKLAFRETVRKYNVDICFTPMILADVFRNSALSRDCELQVSHSDEPLIVQFAASNGKDAADAAEMICNYSNGVDINCGCPQSWAWREGIGSYLSSHPEITEDIVDQVKRRTCSIKMLDGLRSFPCSIKIRIDKDLRKTVELCQRAEKMGCDMVTVHGRLKSQKNEGKANLDAIKLVKEHLSIPVFGNGGIESISQANEMASYTKVDGVMVAQGLLYNPALFAGCTETPIECVKEFVDNSLRYPLSSSNHFIFHHHLMYMLEKRMRKPERTFFNTIQSTAGVLDYLEENYSNIFP
jgi:tRNA-dihydrouridine synthase 4